MWLLHTKTLELRELTWPHEVEYAILSHVWEDSDRAYTFQDIRAIHARCVLSGENPLSLVAEKVRRFCLYAERAGYEWVWLDTCCIDKSSSAELSEAINSMFAWYKQAVVCYAYLCDVDDDDDPRSPESGFRRSRWHTRGWTLQELIAPREVIFISRGWLTIGTKVALVAVLADVSGIDSTLLIHHRGTSYASFSVAQRMSWASKRGTTRVEDRAYCLMGLFDITMPIIYGEGERAFARLQGEILRTVRDDSIFAWGAIHTDLAFWDRGRLHMEPQHTPANLAGDGDTPMLFVTADRSDFDGHYYTSELLARSPSDFASSADYVRLSGELPFEAGTDGHYTFISDALSTGVPISIDPLPAEEVGADSKQELLYSKVYAAALRCTKLLESGTRTSALGASELDVTAFLILFFRDMDLGERWLSAGVGRRYYQVGAEVRTARGLQRLRGAVVYAHDKGAALASVFSMRELIVWNRIQVYILRPLPIPHPRCQFHIPSWSLRRLQIHHGFELQGFSEADGATATVVQPHWHPGSRAVEPPSVIFNFVKPSCGETLTIRFGVGCECNRPFVPIVPHDWWIHVHATRRQTDPPVTYGFQFVPRNRGHSPPFMQAHRRNPECTQRHISLNPLNKVHQYAAFALDDRTVHIQTALTDYSSSRIRPLRPPSDLKPPRITVMIDLEGFDRQESISLNDPGSTALLSPSAENLQDHPHPQSSSSWLSRSWSSLRLPGTAAFIPPLPGVRSLKDWLASGVDYTYGSLV